MDPFSSTRRNGHFFSLRRLRQWASPRAALLALVALFLFLKIYSPTSNQSTSQTQSPSENVSEHADFLQPEQLTPEILEAQNIEIVEMTASSIPKIVHFIYGLKGPKPTLDLIHYLAIKSAHDVIRPDKIYMHYHYLPQGEWFEKAKPYLILREISLVERVFDKPVESYAHRADVSRLEILIEFGGIYLDMDVISLKSFDDLLKETFIMGHEGVGGWNGLGNSVILSRPRAPFLQRWQATYKFFDKSQWNYHSIVLPGVLAKYFPDEITQLPYNAFFWPLWDKNGLRQMYLEKSYDFAENYAIHLWESAASVNLIKDLTIDVIENVDTSFNCIIRKFIRAIPYEEDWEHDRGCTILESSRRADGMVGHWPLFAPGPKAAIINPLKLRDVSGNDMNGLVRNGEFQYTQSNQSRAKPSYLNMNGRDAYTFFPMPNGLSLSDFSVSWWMKIPKGYRKQGATAIMVHTDYIKLYIETELMFLDSVEQGAEEKFSESLGLALRTIDFSPSNKEKQVPASPYQVDTGQWHHYVFVISASKESHKVVLYQDGYVILSDGESKLPHVEGTIRGVWIGNAEPETTHYQDRWDERFGLNAGVRDVRAWGRTILPDEVRKLASMGMYDYSSYQKDLEKQNRPHIHHEDDEVEEEDDEEEIDWDEENGDEDGEQTPDIKQDKLEHEELEELEEGGKNEKIELGDGEEKMEVEGEEEGEDEEDEEDEEEDEEDDDEEKEEKEEEKKGEKIDEQQEEQEAEEEEKVDEEVDEEEDEEEINRYGEDDADIAKEDDVVEGKNERPWLQKENENAR